MEQGVKISRFENDLQNCLLKVNMSDMVQRATHDMIVFLPPWQNEW